MAPAKPTESDHKRNLAECGDVPCPRGDTDDGLSEEERSQLHDSIRRGLDQMRSGQGRPAQDVLADLRSRT
jgi:hypothetical protein